MDVVVNPSNVYNSQALEKTVTRHIWEDHLKRAKDIRHSHLGKTSYTLGSQTTPRVFADSKEKHAMHYTLYRGLKAVTNWVRLKYAAINFKNLALWKTRSSTPFYF